ncbi:MAG: YjhG/YagF family D-xylonate dehydratase [Verrucomicrobia bacterium]|nr:YjhG/YagF family D-xylonate dehydratase [Verrucomicrobiota bacterium]
MNHPHTHRSPKRSRSEDLYRIRTRSPGPRGRLPLTAEMLRRWPSGHLFGLSQDAGMGWTPAELRRKQFLILSTQGGLRMPDGRPLALGYHTGHWELDDLVEAAAIELRALGAIPFAGYCSDPCDGRSQGTPAMFDSLPYRNDAAIVLRRLIRSLPRRAGVLGIATCDKGLPAMMMALVSMRDLPAVLVPGGVALPPERGEDAGKIQTIGARFSHGLISLQEAAELGCRACASPGGGCQFLGTAATSQVVGEALGLSLPHSALAPSGQPVWLELARQSARTLARLERRKITVGEIVTPASIRNAMAVHAAFGGSTNLLLHLPAIAHAAGLPRPSAADWLEVNRRVPRLVDALPNGPRQHPTVQVFLAGGVPEVMRHLRDLGLLDLAARTVTGRTLEADLAAWERSERRRRFRQILRDQDGIDPDDVILSPAAARGRGLSNTVAFLDGNLAPEGAIVKSTAIDPSLLDPRGIYAREGPARVFTTEAAAMEALKAGQLHPGDILVLMGCGPLGTGMEETYQLTSALKHVPWGKEVTLITDARFSGVSTGACIGHVGPEALAGGPLGRVREGDRVRIVINTQRVDGRVDWIGDRRRRYPPAQASRILLQRPLHPALRPHPDLPLDTRLWAAMQEASGGAWGGCVYDADRIATLLERGRDRSRRSRPGRK